MSQRILLPLLVLVAFVLGQVPSARAQAADDDLDDPQKSIKRFSKVIEKSPSDAEAWYFLGRAHVQLKQWQEALDALTKAVELNPQDARAQYRKGEALDGLKRPADAVKAYEAALAIDPAMLAAQGKLATAYMGDKRYDDAIKIYKEALKAEPPDKAAYYTNIGTACYKKGDMAQAMKWFEKTVELAPDSAVTYFNLGAMYRRLGKEDAALLAKSADAFKKAADLDAGNARTQFLAAESLFFVGRNAEVKAYLDRYFTLDPSGAKIGAEDHAAAKAYRAELAK